MASWIPASHLVPSDWTDSTNCVSCSISVSVGGRRYPLRSSRVNTSRVCSICRMSGVHAKISSWVSGRVSNGPSAQSVRIWSLMDGSPAVGLTMAIPAFSMFGIPVTSTLTVCVFFGSREVISKVFRILILLSASGSTPTNRVSSSGGGDFR